MASGGETTPTRDGQVVLRRAAAVWEGAPGRRELRRGVDVYLEDGRVAAIGRTHPLRANRREIDAGGWLVLPGFVNAHHHLSQQLTRTACVGGDLVDWLTELYPVWSRLDEEAAYRGARGGIAELLLTGVTTTNDFTYFYPRGRTGIFDAQVRAAAELGCRFMPVRGGLAEIEAGVRSRLGGALAGAVEDRDTLLAEAARAVEVHHDPAPDAQCRVALGLTEKAYGDAALMRELAALAAEHDVRLHTHLHPRPDERVHAMEALGVDPIAFLRDTGWWSERLWVAHGTRLEPREVRTLAHQGVALCTCPSSNARFGAPVAPAWALHRLGGTVAVGVDGAASNDSGDFVAECRLTWQLQRTRAAAEDDDAGTLSPDVVLEWATAGGAQALGWPELGRLVEGGLADVACFDMERLDFVGTDDPLAALLLCGISHRAALVTVGGRIVVEGGRLTSADEEELTIAARASERRLKPIR